ncbi:MAG: fructose-6-phosphate aldolase [Anaplasma sp.]
MKIFLDTVDLDAISALCETGVVDGVTTNPLLLSKSEESSKKLLLGICKAVKGPVSIEVIATDAGAMVDEGLKLAKIAPNVVVKLPMTFDGIRACSVLSSKHKIKVNVTLCFSVTQAVLAAKAGAAFVSPFMGRIDDLGWSGTSLIEDISHVYSQYNFSTQILAASIRSPQHVVEAARAGADVVTVPVAIFKQLFSHPLTDRGLESFLKAWSDSGKSILV